MEAARCVDDHANLDARAYPLNERVQDSRSNLARRELVVLEVDTALRAANGFQFRRVKLRAIAQSLNPAAANRAIGDDAEKPQELVGVERAIHGLHRVRQRRPEEVRQDGAGAEHQRAGADNRQRPRNDMVRIF